MGFSPFGHPFIQTILPEPSARLFIFSMAISIGISRHITNVLSRI